MTTFMLHPLAIGALAILMSASDATSQTVSPILNTLEVQTLVASSEPADNAKLSAHFAALADIYTADARQHTAMAKAASGNPSRSLGTGMSTHCKRLAQLNTESGQPLRELAAHHKRLAGGAASTAPRAGARFEAGANAPDPSAEELSAVAAKASTPAHHRALERYFLTLSKRYVAEASAHVTMARAYRDTGIAQAAAHCDHLVTLIRDSVKEATEAAALHKQLANTSR